MLPSGCLCVALRGCVTATMQRWCYFCAWWFDFAVFGMLGVATSMAMAAVHTGPNSPVKRCG